jgi:hypothetical protein
MKALVTGLALAASLLFPSPVGTGEAYPPGHFLPADQTFDGWSLEGGPKSFAAQELYGRINGGAEIFLQYRFEELGLADYSRPGPSGKEEITCEIYRMSSAEDAFGIFSIQRAGGEPVSTRIGALNWTGEMQSGAVKDRYYVSVTGFSTTAAAIEAFAARVIRAIPGPSLPPPVFRRFPGENQVKGSRRLLRGPLAAAEESPLLQDPAWGFAGGTTAYSARYGKANTKLILVSMDGAPAGIEKVEAVFRRYLEEVRLEKGLLSGKNPIGRFFLCAIAGNEAVLVLGEPDQDSARRLLDSLIPER